jgi:hypothetical protein
MSRTLSAAAVRELLAQESGEVFLQLLTLSHPQMTTLRVVNNTQDVVSRGNTYLAFPFSLELPADLAEEMPNVQLMISNADRRLVDELRTVVDPITVTLEIVAAGVPDTVEVGPFSFDLSRVVYGKDTITGTLSTEPILQEPFPADTFNPKDFPGLFQ